MAMGWSAAQVAWLKKNDPAKLAKGYKASGANKGVEGGYQGGGGAAPKPAAPSGGNKGTPIYKGVNEAPKVTDFSDKGAYATAGANKDLIDFYKRSQEGKLTSSEQQYWGQRGFRKDMTQAQWLELHYGTDARTNPGVQPSGEHRVITGYKAPPAPVKRSGGGGGSALNAYPEFTGKPVDAPITQDERDEITPPASGLEDTIKTSPQLLRERRRRSYLTRG